MVKKTAEKSKVQPAILFKMETLRSSLTKSEQQVVDCILSDPGKIIYSSVAELAERSGVSDPSVVRCCRKLGLDGYQDLKITLARELVFPLKSINEEITENDDAAAVVDKVFHTTVSTLNLTLETINKDDIEKTAEALLAARKIVALGVGNSHSIVVDMQHKLMRLDKDVVAFSDSHLATIALAYCDERDVAFCISHSGSSKEVVDLAKLAKKNKVKIISLTNVGVTPLGRISDIALHTASNETQYRIFGLNSRIAQLAVIDAVYTLLAMKTGTAGTLKVEDALKDRKY